MRIEVVPPPPLEFVCSECGKRVTRDSYTFYASMVAPDETKKCSKCGHVPDTTFYYCSPECLKKGVKRHGLHRPYRVFWGLYKVPEWWPHKVGSEKKIEETEGKFHKKFPKLAKKLDLECIGKGFPTV